MSSESSLIIHLKKEGLADVLGLDNFDPYYSQSLKLRRVARVQENGTSIVDGDICDGPLLKKMFDENDYTHIVNLAAQPGVRYSFKKPMAYIRNNLQVLTSEFL